MSVRTREGNGSLCLDDARGRYKAPGDMSSIGNSVKDNMYANESSRAEYLCPLTPLYVPFGIRRLNSNHNLNNSEVLVL